MFISPGLEYKNGLFLRITLNYCVHLQGKYTKQKRKWSADMIFWSLAPALPG